MHVSLDKKQAPSCFYYRIEIKRHIRFFLRYWITGEDVWLQATLLVFPLSHSNIKPNSNQPLQMLLNWPIKLFYRITAATSNSVSMNQFRTVHTVTCKGIILLRLTIHHTNFPTQPIVWWFFFLRLWTFVSQHRCQPWGCTNPINTWVQFAGQDFHNVRVPHRTYSNITFQITNSLAL